MRILLLEIQFCYTTKHYLNVAFSYGSVISFKGLTTHKWWGGHLGNRPKNNLLCTERVFSKPVQKTPIQRLWCHWKMILKYLQVTSLQGSKFRCLHVDLSDMLNWQEISWEGLIYTTGHVISAADKNVAFIVLYFTSFDSSTFNCRNDLCITVSCSVSTVMDL